MRFFKVVSSILFMVSFAAAQGAPAGTNSGVSPDPHGMAAMHQKHMQEMQTQVQGMRATLEQLRTNAAKIQDPAAHQQAELDVSLWDSMVKHMEGMLQTMSQHDAMDGGGMGMGMHGGGGAMSCCGEHGGGAAGCCASMGKGGCCGGGKCSQPKATPASLSPANSL